MKKENIFIIVGLDRLKKVHSKYFETVVKSNSQGLRNPEKSSNYVEYGQLLLV